LSLTIETARHPDHVCERFVSGFHVALSSSLIAVAIQEEYSVYELYRVQLLSKHGSAEIVLLCAGNDVDG
jgi:hypothetical protein